MSKKEFGQLEDFLIVQMAAAMECGVVDVMDVVKVVKVVIRSIAFALTIRSETMQ